MMLLEQILQENNVHNLVRLLDEQRRNKEWGLLLLLCAAC